MAARTPRQLTLFVNKTCTLCDAALKALTLARLQLSNPARTATTPTTSIPSLLTASEESRHDSLAGEELRWQVVDITRPENKHWNELYCFDVPVLHFDNGGKHSLMHHIYADEILSKLKALESGEPKTITLGKKRW